MEQKYIVGDLVRYTSLYKEPVAEICEVRETSYLIRFMNENFAKVTKEEIKPIPLTPEILEKNGWKIFVEQHDFRYAFKIDDSCYLVVMTGFLDGIRIFIRKGTIYSKLRTLKYVSDLQHLLFGLGLNSEMKV